MTPLAFTLWNEKDGECWPKTEDDLSDVVAAHLRRDLPRGVDVVREGEVWRGKGYLDLLITAQGFPRDRASRVVVEVKGNWNKALHSAMQEQLVERYLRETQAAFGLYLVGWFASEYWKSKDAVPESRSLDIERQKLEMQASTLSHANHLRVEALVLDCQLHRLRGSK